MPPMLISLLQVIVNSVILLIIYCYLYVREKKDYLRIWALGWFFQFLRFICEIWLVYRNFSLPEVFDRHIKCPECLYDCSWDVYFCKQANT